MADAIAEAAAEGEELGARFARDPAWVVNQVLDYCPGDVWAAYLTTTHAGRLEELKLGKKTQALLDEAEQLHKQLDRYAYGPPRIEFSEADVDQARAAGVLLELGRAPIVLDRALYRELAKGAVARTVETLRARVGERAEEKAAQRRGARDQRERSPLDQLEAEHRAQAREYATRAHGVNLDLGAALLDTLATVDPADMNVARFFAHGLLGTRQPELPRHRRPHGAHDRRQRTAPRARRAPHRPRRPP